MSDYDEGVLAFKPLNDGRVGVSIWKTVDALWQLARLAVLSNFKLRGAYWKWRAETAFGTNAKRMPSRAARLRAVLQYGAWVGQMRRLAARGR